MKLTIEVTEKQARQIVNLFEHWAEVQHDGNDDTTPSEEFCGNMVDDLVKQIYELGYRYDIITDTLVLSKGNSGKMG